ncbi:phage late control D family protein [Roseateles chitinivorans]|uniref:phage late control D family protein n=1 Tax=Roseateles chitinivorans TaxID=2917965 RepID=UPI003D66EB07
MTETSVSRSAIFSARPTLRIAGQADERLSTLMTAMKMEEHEGGMSALELRVTNWVATGDGRAELAFNGSSSLKLGAELGVYTGDEAAPREIFKGKVSALEMVCNYGAPPELVVLAEDALSAARRARRSKVYTDMTPADVVNAIAGGLGLTPSVTGLTSAPGTWAQLDETDLGFLRRLLARFDADLQVVGTQLQVTPRKDVQRGTIDLTLYSQLARVRITADLADQPTAVSVAGWNAKDGSAVKGEAGTVANAGPGQGSNGVAWAGEVFGDRNEHLAAPAVYSTDEARAVAEAALDQRARRFVRAEGVSEGNAQLRVGSCVRLTGVSPQFDNTYYVVRACHLFDMKQGYRTEFSAECAFLGA